MNITDLVKIALACVITGGGAAAVVGRLEAQTVHSELEAHKTANHPEVTVQISEAKRELLLQAAEARQSAVKAQLAAQEASYEARYTNALLKTLLSHSGLTLPQRPPMAPTSPARTRKAKAKATPSTPQKGTEPPKATNAGSIGAGDS